MKYLCTIILIAGLFMGQAWGGDDPFLYSPDPNDIDFIDNRVENEELYIIDWKVNCNDGEWNIYVGENGPAIYYCENDEWVYQGDILFVKPPADGITLPFGSAGIVPLDTELKEPKEILEIRAILERCLEIVQPGAVIIIPNEFGMPYAVASDYGIEQLRRDIDELLKRLTSE